jgi:hypothetical protein
MLASVALALAIPAIAQESPKSLLPEGFGEPDAPQKSDEPDAGSQPTELLPDVKLRTPGSGNGSTKPSSSTKGSTDAASADGEKKDGEDDETATVAPVLQDLPPGARRSTARVGLLDSDNGGLGESAFGTAPGKYLSHLMRHLDAPIASRWSSILLRRALLTKSATPADVNGADWVAERAWLLIRMGEAQSAQLLVQSVDVDQYTPKLTEIAMQASLATADPGGLCAISEAGPVKSEEPAWAYAKAICHALSGESSVASAQIDAARDKRAGQAIDSLLAEKVVGAGGNTRRAVVIEWEPVKQLTAWRYGMATATGLEIPERLMATVGPQVRAWRARAPLLPIQKRIGDADIAAALGVLSSAALVDYYGAWSDATDTAQSSGTPFTLLRTAYAGPNDGARLTAMQALWNAKNLDFRAKHARQVLTARAAAMIVPSDATLPEAGNLVGSMFTAGLDVQATRWAKIANNGSEDSELQAWALLAAGAPGKAVNWDTGRIRKFQSSVKEGPRGAFLFAAMAGLDRISADDASSMAESLSIPIGRQTRWTKALDRAVARREPGTVALLCAVGLQTPQWKQIPPQQVYHIVSALRRVGLAAEARMIAAEAITRG